MNRPDDFVEGDDLDLHNRLSSLLGDEPPMESMPGDDLQRGRRLVRRRRWGAVGTAAVLVPALAVGAAAASNGLFAASSGPDKVIPEGTTTEVPTDDPSCGTVDLASPGLVPLGAEPNTVLPGPNGAKGSSVATGKAESSAQGIAPGGVGTASGEGTSSTATEDPHGSVSCVTGDSDGANTAICAAADQECVSYPDDPQQNATMDRLTQLLDDQLDPTGTHTKGSFIGAVGPGPVSVGGGSTDQGTPALMVGRPWTEGNHEGAVTLSVAPTADPGLVGTGCSDLTMLSGPEVTCEQRTLADGTVIEVGHGQKDGAGRLTVGYEREDGQVVIATADQASSGWWEMGDGPEPLDDLPATVEQLTALVTSPGAHL